MVKPLSNAQLCRLPCTDCSFRQVLRSIRLLILGSLLLSAPVFGRDVGQFFDQNCANSRGGPDGLPHVVLNNPGKIIRLEPANQ